MKRARGVIVFHFGELTEDELREVAERVERVAHRDPTTDARGGPD